MGKSSWCHDQCRKNNWTYYDIINPRKGSLWFDGYDGQQAIILDDFYGWIDPATLFRMLDIYAMQLPIKGNFTWAFWNYVFITSNNPPEQWYKPEVMEKIDKSAFYRRLHKICVLEKKYDEDSGDDYVEFYYMKDEPGVVPKEQTPILSKFKYNGNHGLKEGPSSYFNTDEYDNYKNSRLQKLKTLAELREDFRIPETPDDTSDSGNQNDIDNARKATIMEIYDVDEGVATTFTRYLDEEYPQLNTQVSEQQSKQDEDSDEDGLYDYRQAEGRHSSVDSDDENKLYPEQQIEVDEEDEDNEDEYNDLEHEDLDNEDNDESEDIGDDDF